MNWAKSLVCVSVCAMALAGCGKGDSSGSPENAGGGSKLSGKIAIDGSSTVYPISEAVSEEFRELHPNVHPTVGRSGTGGGFKRFVKGETDISDASRPIKKKELEAVQAAGIEFIEVPVAYDGLSIVVNKGNTWVKSLTVDDLKKLFLADSKVKTWKDLNAAYPAEPVKMFIPGTDSGTFDYFKEVVAGKSGSIRPDVSASEDDNVLVKGIAGEKGAIGFFGCAYYFENKDKLRVIPIDGGSGPIEPTPETIEGGTYAPFSRPLFIYVKKSATEKPEVDAFVKFYLEQGPALAEEVGYVKLPAKIMDRVKKNYADRSTGTQFLDDQGEKVHGPLSKVYQ